MGTRWLKKELALFLKLESFIDKQLSISTHYSICYTICLSILYLYPFIFITRERERQGISQLVKKISEENI